MDGWVLKMKLMLTQLSNKLELKLKLKLSLAKIVLGFIVGLQLSRYTKLGNKNDVT